MKNILKYFFGGFVALIPLFVLYQVVKIVSSLVKSFIPEINIVYAFFMSFVMITLFGYLMSKGVAGIMHGLILKASKKKGFVSLFAGALLHFKSFSKKTKNAFKHPVCFEVSDGIYKLGFVTNEDVKFLISEDDEKRKVAVYAPEPISFIGELLFIEKGMIKKIESIDKEDIPVFLYTAGIIEKIK